jgi:hypothetical protein
LIILALKLAMKKRDTIFYILYFIIIIYKIYSLDNYHSWGGDFSLYLNQSKSLFNGNYYSLLDINDEMMKNGKVGPNLYPIVFPLVISPLFLFENPEFFYFKIYLFIFFLIGLFYLNKIICSLNAPKIVRHLVLISFLMWAGTSGMNNSIMSDQLNLTFNLISIYYFIKYITNGCTKRNIFLASLFIALGTFTRTTSIVILFAIYLFYLLQLIFRKQKIKQIITECSFISFPTLFLIILNIYIPLERAGSNEFISILNSDILIVLKYTIPYYLELMISPIESSLNLIITSILRHFYSTHSFKHLLNEFTYYFTLAIYLLAILSFMFHIVKKREKSFLFICITCTLLLVSYLLYPITQGSRYIVLIFPFLFYMIIYSINLIGYSWKYILMFVFILLIITPQRNIFQKSFYEKYSFPGSKNFNLMTNYIKDSITIEKNEFIACAKPRVLYFFTGKLSYRNIDYFNTNEKKMKYILLRNGVDNDSLEVSYYQKELILEKKYGNLSLLKCVE